MTNSSGIGTPSWYEWEIGLIKCLEMLYDESIMSVVFQSSAFQSIDDVVVNYKDHSMINIQVKHTDVSANFNYSFITSDGNLLLSLAQDWLKVKSRYNIKEIQIATNKPWGTHASKGKLSFSDFVSGIFPKLKSDYDYSGTTPTEAATIEWYKSQLSSLDKEDAVEFTRLLSFNQAPNRQEIDERIDKSLLELFGVKNIEVIKHAKNSLIARLRVWSTSFRKREEVYREDVYSALCVEENFSQYELLPEKPIFPSRVDFAAEFISDIKTSTSKLFVLEGLPGAGKTNFVSYLAQLEDSIVDFRFYTYLPHSKDRPCFSDDSGAYHSDLLWGTLLVQLRKKFAELNVLAEVKFPLAYNLMSSDEKRFCVLKYLSLYIQYTHKPCYIFIDGLDHAIRYKDLGSTFISQLPAPEEIADGVKFVLVTQPVTNLYPSWLAKSNRAISFYTMPQLKPIDVEMLISHYSISIPHISKTAFAESIIDVVGNNTLNILFAMQEVSRLASSQTYDEIVSHLIARHLNTHIRNYYEWMYESLARTASDKLIFLKISTIFAFISKEISFDDITRLIGCDSIDVSFYIDSFFPLVQHTGQFCYVLHNDVRLFLRDKIVTNSISTELAKFFYEKIKRDATLNGLKYYFLFNMLLDLSNLEMLVELFDYNYIIGSMRQQIPISVLLSQFQSLTDIIYREQSLDYINSISMASTTLSQYINCAEYYGKESIFSPAYECGQKVNSEKYILNAHINRDEIINDIYKLLSKKQIERARHLYEEYFSGFSIINLFGSPSTDDDSDNWLSTRTDIYEKLGYVCRVLTPDILSEADVPATNKGIYFAKGWLDAGKNYIDTCGIKDTLRIRHFDAEDFLQYIKSICFGDKLSSEQLSVIDLSLQQYVNLPLMAAIELCTAEILSDNTNLQLCELLFERRYEIISDATFTIDSYKLEYFFKLYFCTYNNYLNPSTQIEDLFHKVLGVCRITTGKRGYPPALELFSIATGIFDSFYTGKYTKGDMEQSILHSASISNRYGTGSCADCEAPKIRRFIYAVIFHISKREKDWRKLQDTIETLTFLFTNEHAMYFRELSPIFLLSNSKSEFENIANYWCGSSGKVWASSYDVIEYTCDDISKVLNSFNSFKLSKEICSRRHARILGYSGHKDYSLNDLLQWFKLIPLSSKKLLDNGMQILSISDTAESIGDNRIGSSIDSELFDVAVQLGPQYMDALFELKNTIDGFYYWRVCLLNSLEKTLPDVNTPDDKLVSIYRLANAWIVPSIEEKKEFNNLNFINTINSKILQSISDTSLKEEILEKVPSISVNEHSTYSSFSSRSSNAYDGVYDRLCSMGYSEDIEQIIIAHVLAGSAYSSEATKFLIDAGLKISDVDKPKYISACVIPYITAFNAYGLRSSGLYELIEEFYMFFTSQNWLDIFKSCTSGNFSIDERIFYYINDDIEIFNVYYNRCNHPKDCERIFNQRAQMQMNWITASGQIQVSTYELEIDNDIRTMGDFTRKHLGL